MMANTHNIHMEQKISTRHIERKGLIISPPNLFTSEVMSTIITHDHSYPTRYMYHDLSNMRSLPKDKKIKRER